MMKQTRLKELLLSCYPRKKLFGKLRVQYRTTGGVCTRNLWPWEAPMLKCGARIFANYFLGRLWIGSELLYSPVSPPRDLPRVALSLDKARVRHVLRRRRKGYDVLTDIAIVSAYRDLHSASFSLWDHPMKDLPRFHSVGGIKVF